MSRMVEANEPDTIDYKFCLDSRDKTKCIVHETYANSEAVLAHAGGLASQTMLPKIFRVARLTRFDVYGSPNDELQNMLASFNAQIYNLFAGFSR